MKITLAGTAALAAALVWAAGAPAQTTADPALCPSPILSFFVYQDPSYCTTTTEDWSVDPAYDGPTYADNTEAAASDPPPATPPAVALPTWRNFYDWPNGHGYAGWH